MKTIKKTKLCISVVLCALIFLFGMTDVNAKNGNPPCDKPASMEGYTLNFFEQPVPNVLMTLDAEFGSQRKTRTNSFGYYRFDDIAPCELHVVRPVNHKLLFEMDQYYFFANPGFDYVWYFFVFNQS